MLNLVVFAPFLVLAAAKPGYYNSVPINPAQGGGSYGGGSSGDLNSNPGRDVSYTRTDVVSKQLKGKGPHSTTNFNGDPSNLLQNAILHGVKNVHYAEENIGSGPVGSRLHEGLQPQINFQSPQQQPQYSQGSGAGFGGGGGGGYSRRRFQNPDQAGAQNRAQDRQDRGFQDFQNQNLDIPQNQGLGGGISRGPQPQPQSRRFGGRYTNQRRTQTQILADIQLREQTDDEGRFESLRQNEDLPPSRQGSGPLQQQQLPPPRTPDYGYYPKTPNSHYIPVLFKPYGAPAQDSYHRHAYYTS